MLTTRELMKGDIIEAQGVEQEVVGGRGGIKRVCKPLSGLDAGWARDAYVFNVKRVKRNGEWQPVTLDPKDAKKAQEIRRFGFE